MLTDSFYSISFTTLPQRYGIARSTLSHRIKQLGLKVKRRGKKTFLTLNQLAQLDELNRFLQNNPTCTIDDFLISADSSQTQPIDQSSTNRALTSHRPIDGYRENIDQSGEPVDFTNNLASNQLRSLEHRPNIDQSIGHRPSLDPFPTTNSPMLLQENKFLKKELSKARQYISELESQVEQEQIESVKFLQTLIESEQHLIRDLLDIIRQQLEQIEILLTH